MKGLDDVGWVGDGTPPALVVHLHGIADTFRRYECVEPLCHNSPTANSLRASIFEYLLLFLQFIADGREFATSVDL